MRHLQIKPSPRQIGFFPWVERTTCANVECPIFWAHAPQRERFAMTDVCLVSTPSPPRAPCACFEGRSGPRPTARPRALTQALFDAFHSACCALGPSERRAWRAVQEPPRPQLPKG